MIESQCKTNKNLATENYCRGLSLYNKDDYKEAIECFDQALKIDPNFLDAHYGKGSAIKELGENIAAIECYD